MAAVSTVHSFARVHNCFTVTTFRFSILINYFERSLGRKSSRKEKKTKHCKQDIIQKFQLSMLSSSPYLRTLTHAQRKQGLTDGH